MDMREADDDALLRGRVVVDSPKAVTEGGDVAVAIAAGAYRADRIAGTLGDLASGALPGHDDEHELTVFKSVGVALEDLAAAIAVWEHRVRAAP
jgi:ornithine cyclodeaminase